MHAALTALVLTAVAPNPAPLPFRHVVVDADSPRDPHCKAAGDLDGDGLADLLAASAAGGGLFWYRAPEWTKHRLADGSFTTDMAVGDLDGGGALDVVIPSGAGLLWFRNPRGDGGDPTGPWPVVNLGRDGANMHDVELADLDGDGRLEVITRHQSGFGKQLGNAVHLWLRDGDDWEHRQFACPHGEGLKVADLTGDGRPDIVIGGRWYEHPGDPRGEWREHRYLADEVFAAEWTNGDTVVQVADINGDGRPDIVLAPAEGRGRLSWCEQPEDSAAEPWREQVVEPGLDHTHGLAVGDFDGDGAADLVLAKMHQATPPQVVRLYLNRNAGADWLTQVLSERGSHNIVAVDFAGDGRLGVFGANWNHARSEFGAALEAWVAGQ